MKADWDAWNSRSLAEKPIVRLILDATVVRVRLDRQATSIVLLVVLGVRQDGQKVLPAVNNMGGETSQAWRAVLADRVERERVRFYDPQTQNVFFPGDRGFDYVASLQDQKIFWGKSN